jgi:L-2,4-diaminobutyrate decarboxylase
MSNDRAHRDLLHGLESADSVAWDAHKWLFQTYGCGMVLVRERRWLPQSFATGAEYTRDATDSEHMDCPNFWNLGLEMTRPARAMKLWFTMQVLGLKRLGEMIDHGFRLANMAEIELKQLPDWKIVSAAQVAIVNFRYAPKGWSELQVDALNTAISRSMLAQNKAAALATILNGRVVMRMCTINSNLTEISIRDIVKAFDEAARALC